jgi:hypothetical protein
MAEENLFRVLSLDGGGAGVRTRCFLEVVIATGLDAHA